MGTMAHPSKRKRPGPPCKCGCGQPTSTRTTEYVRGHRPPIPLADRYWDKVALPLGDGCWGWTGATVSKGYGLIVGPGNKHHTAHRLSWELHNGPIPEGMWVLHHCDNPPCTRPSHLYLGTVVENVRDAWERGRMPRRVGEAASNTRLTDAQVAEIRRRHRPRTHPARRTGRSSSELAQEFGVTKQYIWQLIAGKWRVG
jgi:hypothetical protein